MSMALMDVRWTDLVQTWPSLTLVWCSLVTHIRLPLVSLPNQPTNQPSKQAEHAKNM
jgi:hypothetical protein